VTPRASRPVPISGVRHVVPVSRSVGTAGRRVRTDSRGRGSSGREFEPEPYTAFPELTPPKSAARFPGARRVRAAINHGPRFPAEENESAFLKTRRAEQIELAIFAWKMCEVRRIGRHQKFDDYLLAKALLRGRAIGAELERTATAKQPWLEERIVALKCLEVAATNRVKDEKESTFALNRLRYWRLGAEQDLLRVREQAKNEKFERPAATGEFHTTEIGTIHRVSEFGQTALNSPIALPRHQGLSTNARPAGVRSESRRFARVRGSEVVGERRPRRGSRYHGKHPHGTVRYGGFTRRDAVRRGVAGEGAQAHSTRRTGVRG